MGGKAIERIESEQRLCSLLIPGSYFTYKVGTAHHPASGTWWVCVCLRDIQLQLLHLPEQ